MERKDIWVYAECRNGQIAPVTMELLGEARRLAEGTEHSVAAVLIGGPVAHELFEHGADIVYHADLAEDFRTLSHTRVICDAVKTYQPLALLFGATALGRSLAPRVASRLQTGLSADCTDLKLLPGGTLVQTRPAFGGNLYASILTQGENVQIATVRPHVMRPLEKREGRWSEEVIALDVKLKDEDLAVEILARKPAASASRLDEADVVVTAGFGVQRCGLLDEARELARLLGGAFAATRKVVDAGKAAPEEQVGQTGVTVAPKLYVALGVSGAVQHIVGMQGAKKIVAVNLDPNAPIFRVADVGLRGDLRDILPELIRMIKEERADGAL